MNNEKPNSDAPATAGVASNAADNKAGSQPVVQSAASTAPKFGGLREGRKRDDGLVPGSPEALEADREKERIRKAKYRAEQKAMVPPAPLPKAPSVASPPQAPCTVPPAVPAVPSAPVVSTPWTAKDVVGPSELVVEFVEELDKGHLTKVAIESHVPQEFLRDLDSFEWPTKAKESVARGLASFGARMMNKTGISPENRDILDAGAGMVAIGACHMRLLKEIRRFGAQNGKPAEEKKP